MNTNVCPDVRIRRVGLNRTDDLLRLEEACFATDRSSRRNLRNLLRSNSAYCVAAYRRGELVGSMTLLFRAGTRSARIYVLAVRKDARRMGLGRRMLQRAEKEAKLRGCTRIRLEVRIDNTYAIRLYENLGYHPTKILPSYYEDCAHALLYVKEL